MSQYLPLLLSGAQAGGSVLSASSEIQAGGAVAAAARYNAQLALLESQSSEATQRRGGQRYLAQKAANAGASGVRLEGTTLDALLRDAAELEVNAINTRRAGINTARLDRSQARAALSQSKTSSYATLLSGAGSAYGTLAKYGLPAKINLGRAPKPKV